LIEIATRKTQKTRRGIHEELRKLISGWCDMQTVRELQHAFAAKAKSRR
jgi:hypothetical protein